jgi:hypothetical protein
VAPLRVTERLISRVDEALDHDAELVCPLIVLLGLIIGLGVARANSPDGAISLPRCPASSISLGDPSVTLTALLPQPTATVLVGHHLRVLVPDGLGFFHIANDKALRSECASLLSDRSTDIVVTALAPGKSYLSSTPTGLGPNQAIPIYAANVEVVTR